MAPDWMHSKLAIAKDAADVDMATLAQRIVLTLLDRMDLDVHLERVRSEYRHGRDTMLAALDRNLPAGSRWAAAAAGIFIWVELPHPADSRATLDDAIARERFSFMLGTVFAAEPASEYAQRCLRLNFSHPHPDEIASGIERLANAVRKAMS